MSQGEFVELFWGAGLELLMKISLFKYLLNLENIGINLILFMRGRITS